MIIYNKDNKPKYERIGTLTLDEVFEKIKEHLDEKSKRRVYIQDFFVHVQSLRLRTFYHTGIECPCCENKASFFAVERNAYNDKEAYHLNLYGYDKDNNEILFTHDHILARSLGGEDHIDNTETMCGPCNWQKGTLEHKKKNLLMKEIDSPEYLEELKIVNENLKQYEHHKKNRKIKP